jgi:pimeloyl-ACP methyl ester carboxylesterase
VLFSVVTTTRREVEWVTRHAGRFFPAQWARFRDGVPRSERDVDKLTGIPGVLIHGRLDLSAPLDIPWMLAASWDGSELVVIDDTGHTRGPTMTAALIATDGFAHPHR